MEALNRRSYVSCVTTGALGLALISLAACNSGETTTATPASGGSAALSGPMVFVNNTGDKTLTSVALKGDSGNAVVNTIDAARIRRGFGRYAVFKGRLDLRESCSGEQGGHDRSVDCGHSSPRGQFGNRHRPFHMYCDGTMAR